MSQSSNDSRLFPQNRQAQAGGPIQHWSTYFPGSELDPNDPRLPIVETLLKFLQDNHATYLVRSELKKYGRVSLDYSQLKAEIPVGDFNTVLKDEPVTVISCLAIAAHNAAHSLRFPVPHEKVNVRIVGYEPYTNLKNMKSNMVEKFLSVRGNVVRTSAIKPLVNLFIIIIFRVIRVCLGFREKCLLVKR